MPDDTPHPPDLVRVAIRSIVVMGVLCAGFGLAFMVLFGYLNRFPRFRPWFLAMGMAVWFGPGVMYLACAYQMRRHSRGAATAALLTAAFQFLCAAALFVVTATFDPVSPLPLVLGVLWLVALGDSMRRLWWARRLLHAGVARTRGFDLAGVAPRPVIPLADHSPSDRDRGK